MNQLFTYVINNLFTLKIIYLKKKTKKPMKPNSISVKINLYILLGQTLVYKTKNKMFALLLQKTETQISHLFVFQDSFVLQMFILPSSSLSGSIFMMLLVGGHIFQVLVFFIYISFTFHKFHNFQKKIIFKNQKKQKNRIPDKKCLAE